MAEPGFVNRSPYHGWLPRSPHIHKEFLRVHVSNTCANSTRGHKPPVAAFGKAIQSNKIMRDLFDLVFEQVDKDPKWFSANRNFRVHDFEHLLSALDTIIDQPPKFLNVKNDYGETIGEPIAVPIYLILDLLSNTSAAYDLFRMKEFNDAMKKLLNSWSDYLVSDKSSSSLNDGPGGWYSKVGVTSLESGLGKWSFEDTYKPDPDTGNHNYRSWDRFFTRELNEMVDGQPLRPVVAPGVLPLLYNACESTVLRTASNVQLHDTFWLKSQNYSLYDMFGGKDYPDLSKHAKDFVGSSIYQAYLSPTDYHRWHSPIHARITKTRLLDGAYFAVLPDDGAPPYDTELEPGDPHGAMNRSQPWLSVVAARAVFIMEPLDPVLPVERICFMAIGMGEVSTCEITAHENTEVHIGDQLGMFHFGGSAYVIIVQPKEGYEVLFQDLYEIPMRPGQHRWINSVIGQVIEKRTGFATTSKHPSDPEKCPTAGFAKGTHEWGEKSPASDSARFAEYVYVMGPGEGQPGGADPLHNKSTRNDYRMCSLQ